MVTILDTGNIYVKLLNVPVFNLIKLYTAHNKDREIYKNITNILSLGLIS